MGMDANFFYFGTVLIVTMGLLAIGIKNERGMLVAFIGAVFGIIFMAQLNSDGGISGFASGASSGVFPAFYLPLLFTVFDLGMVAYEGTR